MRAHTHARDVRDVRESEGTERSQKDDDAVGRAPVANSQGLPLAELLEDDGLIEGVSPLFQMADDQSPSTLETHAKSPGLFLSFFF